MFHDLHVLLRVSTVFHVHIAQICCLLRYDVTEGLTAECANSTWRDEYVR